MHPPFETHSLSLKSTDSLAPHLEQSHQNPEAPALSGLQAEYLAHIAKPPAPGAGRPVTGGEDVQKFLGKVAILPPSESVHNMENFLAHSPYFVKVKK